MAAKASPARTEGAKTRSPRTAAAAKPARAPRTKAASPKPARTRSPKAAADATRQARRTALAAEFRAEIEQYARAFNESRDCAIDRLVAEHDELDRIVSDILELAAETAAAAREEGMSVVH